MPPLESLCRIVLPEDWKKATDCGFLPLLDLDKTSGFVHLSTIEQVLETLALYFVPEQRPLILVLHNEVFKEKLKWEMVAHRNHQTFPHLYRQLSIEDVKGILEVYYDEEWVFGIYRKKEEYIGISGK